MDRGGERAADGLDLPVPADDALDVFGVEFIVGVGEGDVLAGRQADPVVPGRVRTVVRLSDLADPVVVERTDDRRGVVRRAVVDNDDLDVHVRLIERGPDRAADHVLAPLGGDDEGCETLVRAGPRSDHEINRVSEPQHA